MYVYIGDTVASPAFSSLPVKWQKAAYGLALPNLLGGSSYLPPFDDMPGAGSNKWQFLSWGTPPNLTTKSGVRASSADIVELDGF